MQMGQAIGAAARGGKHRGKKVNPYVAAARFSCFSLSMHHFCSVCTDRRGRGNKCVHGVTVDRVHKETVEQKDSELGYHKVSHLHGFEQRMRDLFSLVFVHVFWLVRMTMVVTGNRRRVSLGHFSLNIGLFWPPNTKVVYYPII